MTLQQFSDVLTILARYKPDAALEVINHYPILYLAPVELQAMDTFDAQQLQQMGWRQSDERGMENYIWTCYTEDCV